MNLFLMRCLVFTFISLSCFLISSNYSAASGITTLASFPSSLYLKHWNPYCDLVFHVETINPSATGSCNLAQHGQTIPSITFALTKRAVLSSVF
jgi:hypothetical protein